MAPGPGIERKRPGDKEDWIEREIRDFIGGPGKTNIIVARGAGEFDGPLPGGLKQRFPSIEIVDLRGAGQFWFFSPSRIARLSSEKLKVIAPLYNILSEEMPTLRQEEEKRQQTQFGAIAGETLAILIAVSGLSVFSLVSRYQAIRAHDESMFVAGSMIDEAITLDTRDADTARTRQLIIGRGCDFLDQADLGTSTDPPIGPIVTCRLERGTRRESLHEDTEAHKQFDEAIKLASLSHQKRGRIEAALALLQARQAYAEFLVRQKDSDGSERAYVKLLQDAQRLGTEHDRPAEFARFEGEARGQIGDTKAGKNDRQGAADSYDAAAAAVKKWLEAIRSESRGLDPQSVAWLVRLYRLAGCQYVELQKPDLAIEQFKLALGARSFKEVEQPVPFIDYEAALVYASMLAERTQGPRSRRRGYERFACRACRWYCGLGAGAWLAAFGAGAKVFLPLALEPLFYGPILSVCRRRNGFAGSDQPSCLFVTQGRAKAGGFLVSRRAFSTAV